MVRLLLIVLTLFLPIFSWASDSFSVQLTQQTIELGKSVEMILTAKKVQLPLDTINLDSLREDFHLNTIAELSSDGNVETWKIKLTPYRTGHLLIPALYFNGHTSSSAQLTVTDPIDSKSKKPFFFRVQISTTMPWVRQQVKVTYHMTSPVRLYDLQLDSLNDADLVTQNLALDTSVNHFHNGDIHQYTTGYAIYNLRSGQKRLELPPLLVRRDGVTTHRFYPPPVLLSVKPLPAYLPTTVPVGRLTLHTNKTVLFTFTDAISSIKFNLTGHGVYPNSLPDASNFISGSNAIHVYTANVTRSSGPGEQGLRNTSHYDVPYKALSQGIRNLPDQRLLYFDPDTAMLQHQYFKLPVIISINKSFAIALVLLICLALLYWLFRLFLFLRARFIRYQYYRQALHQLSVASRPAELRIVMQLVCKAENLNPNISPQFWLARFAGNESNLSLRCYLNELFYQNSPAEIQTHNKQELAAIIKSCRPVLLLW